jgi:hypothetical protein
MKMSDFGPVRRWREGDVLFAENDWISAAYVATDDPEKLTGWRMGWHPYDGTEICVEYITPEQAKAWDSKG